MCKSKPLGSHFVPSLGTNPVLAPVMVVLHVTLIFPLITQSHDTNSLSLLYNDDMPQPWSTLTRRLEPIQPVISGFARQLLFVCTCTLMQHVFYLSLSSFSLGWLSQVRAKALPIQCKQPCRSNLQIKDFHKLTTHLI